MTKNFAYDEEFCQFNFHRNIDLFQCRGWEGQFLELSDIETGEQFGHVFGEDFIEGYEREYVFRVHGTSVSIRNVYFCITFHGKSKNKKKKVVTLLFFFQG